MIPAERRDSDDAVQSRTGTKTSSAVLRRGEIIFVGASQAVRRRRPPLRLAAERGWANGAWGRGLHPAPAADATAPLPPAAPDAAAAARTGTDDDHLSFVDPIVQGARKATVERHRHRRAGG